MIKLETTQRPPCASTLLTIESASPEYPSVILATDEARKLDDLSNNWVPDPTKLKQIVNFITPDGEASQLSGTVLEHEAVDVPTCYKVVALCDMSVRKKAAREAGGFSGSYVQFNLRRVVEVWESPGKCLWKLKLDEVKGGKVMDSNGKVKAA